MEPLIAIYHKPDGFSDRWIEYCGEHAIRYKLVDCRASGIIRELAGVDGLLWNWNQESPEDQLIAGHVLTAAEQMGIKTYPDFPTRWHFDDKIAQKYLLEAIQAPLVPSYVFVEREAAMQWIEGATFPKVSKLRCGAGSCNVALVKTRQEAARLCRQMFGRGRPAAPAGYFYDVRRKIRQTRDLRHFLEKLKRMPDSLRHAHHIRHLQPVQRGYVYFQDFLPNNAFDNRVTVVGGRAFAFLRMNRPGDFRASGSGEFIYDQAKIDLRCVRLALDTAKRLATQSLSFDFLLDENGAPAIAEISYTTNARFAAYNCPGYWDEDLHLNEGHFWMQDFILQDFLAQIAEGNTKSTRPLPLEDGRAVRA
jgi:glutathione synthase/RimK-type ligase-like ATP-grasp enzyme